MPIVPPRLDDRRFSDLADELVARIPAHSPEWTHARVGDPGRTLLELFAWLADTILYRANLVPERQRLAFLRLLGVQLEASVAATGVVSVQLDEDAPATSVSLAAYASIPKPVPFETLTELTVLPVTGEAYSKRPITDDERTSLAPVLIGLPRVYGVAADPPPAYYVATPVFPAGAPDAQGFDLVAETVDHCLWIALLAAKPELCAGVTKDLGEGRSGEPRVLSVGVMPAIEVPDFGTDVGASARVSVAWDLSAPDADGSPVYHTLTVISDTTQGFTRRGVVQLLLPATADIGASTNDVRQALSAGVGDRPPRLDDPSRGARLVAWLRLRPVDALASLRLSWVGINAVEIDQRQTVTGRVVGQSTGAADQQISVGQGGVDRDTFQLQVEEPGMGYQPWALIDDTALAGRDDAVASLDTEAGLLTFGDGVRGRVPATGMRVRVARMRVGGGAAGNLPPATLKAIGATLVDGSPVGRKLKVVQALPTLGGADAETLPDAEARIPAMLRHGNRAVTSDDYVRIAADTPGVSVGRVDVIPLFLPQQRQDGIPGVVSVMVLPQKAAQRPPNPRPDRPFLETVHAYLDARRPLGTELYTIGCEYVRVAVAVGITVKDGFGVAAVTSAVTDALYQHLWPLPPGGLDGQGWVRGKSVRDRELEVIVAQVPGVDEVDGVNLFQAPLPVQPAAGQQTLGASFVAVGGALGGAPLGAPAAVPVTAGASAGAPAPTTPAGAAGRVIHWARVTPPSAQAAAEIAMEEWQLPELLAVVVSTDGTVPTDVKAAPPAPAETGVAVPVVPEVC